MKVNDGVFAGYAGTWIWYAVCDVFCEAVRDVMVVFKSRLPPVVRKTRSMCLRCMDCVAIRSSSDSPRQSSLRSERPSHGYARSFNAVKYGDGDEHERHGSYGG